MAPPSSFHCIQVVQIGLRVGNMVLNYYFSLTWVECPLLILIVVTDWTPIIFWAKLSVSRKGSLTYLDESMNASFENILSQRIFLPGNEQLLSGCIIPVFTQRHNRISRFCPWTAATLFVLAAFIEGYGDDWQKRLAGWWVFCYYCIYGQQVRGVCSIMITDHARWLQHWFCHFENQYCEVRDVPNLTNKKDRRVSKG